VDISAKSLKCLRFKCPLLVMKYGISSFILVLCVSLDSSGEVGSQRGLVFDQERSYFPRHFHASGSLPGLRDITALSLHLRVKEDGHHCQSEGVGLGDSIHRWVWLVGGAIRNQDVGEGNWWNGCQEGTIPGSLFFLLLFSFMIEFVCMCVAGEGHQ